MWGNLSLDSDFHHVVLATIQALRIPAEWPKSPTGIYTKYAAGTGAGDAGSLRFIHSGAGRALVEVREKTPRQLGYVSLVEMWSLLAKEFGS